MFRFVAAAVVLIFAALIPTTFAQAPATQSSVLTEFDRDYTTLFVIPDPLPNVQRLLNSQALARVWNTGKLTTFIKKNDPTVKLPDLQAVWFIVLQANRWVPDEIAFGMTPRSWDQVDHLMRSVLLFNTIAGAQSAPQLHAERVKLQPELAKELSQLSIPEMRIWVRLRDENDTAMIFSMVSEQAQAFAGGTPFLKVAATDTAVKFSFALADVLTTEGDRMNALRGMGLIRDSKDPGAKALSDAMAKWKFTAELAKSGSGLRLTFGEPPAGSAKAQAMAAADVKIEPGTILFATWDSRPLMAHAKEWIKLAERMRTSPLHEHAPGGGFAESMQLMAEQLLQSAARGSSRMGATEDGVEFNIVQRDVPTAEPLSASPIVKMIPADIEAFSAHSIDSLSHVIANSLAQIEMRMDQQAGQIKSGRDPHPQAKRGNQEEVEKFIGVAKKHVKALREYGTGEAARSFKNGLAIVVSAKGTIKKLEIRPKDDKPFVGQNLPALEFALLGVPASPQQGTDYAKQMYQHLHSGVIGVINEMQDKTAKPINAPASAAVLKADLGLGVETFTFDTSWVKQIAADHVKFTLEGDLRPHYFVHNGVLVFSTSPRLSKQLIETANGGKSIALPAPAADQKGQLVGFGNFDGKLAATFFDQAALWAKAGIDQLGPSTKPAGDDFDPADVPEVIRGVGEFFALIDRSPWQAWQEGDTRTMRGSISFVK